MRKQLYGAMSLFCVCLGIGSSVLLPSAVVGETLLQRCAHDEQGEYVTQGNALLGNPWYRNGGWYTSPQSSPEEKIQEDCTWI